MHPDRFLVLLAGSTAIDGTVAAVVLFARTRDRPITTRRIAAAAAAAVFAFVLKLPILLEAGVNPVFGVMSFAYVDAVVLVPALALLTLLASRAGRRTSGPARAVAVAGLLPAVVGVYATWIEPFRLRLEEATIRVAPWRAGRGVVKVGVLTDLQADHVGDHERRAVALLMAQKPDLILLPGDIFQGSDAAFARELPALRALLGTLDAPGGVFVVPGDVDRPPDRLKTLALGTHLTPLFNESRSVAIGDRVVTVCGVELDWERMPARMAMEGLEYEGGDDVRILLAHRPDPVLGVARRSRVDLVVAGHTHGGQVVIPGFGPPLTLTHVPRAVAAGGLHFVDGNAIYVSRGVGCERGQAPRIRLFCPPEVSLLTLRRRD
jgi:predicted MPP superfamily phosphohydrolase